MPAVFEKMGVRFMYPDNWTLDEDDALHGDLSVTVYSPTGAFWSIVLHPRDADPAQLAHTALEAMKQTYEGLEDEPVDEEVAKVELTGYDLNFYCLDLTNTAQIRACKTTIATCLILWQAEDRDLSGVEPVFRAMTTSLLSDK